MSHFPDGRALFTEPQPSLPFGWGVYWTGENEMKMCRRGARIIAMAFVGSLSNSMCFSVRAADLLPILQGGGYYSWTGYYVGGNLGAGIGRTAIGGVRR